MSQEVSVAVLALGGYGNVYLGAMFAEGEAHNVKFVAGIDPNPATCRFLGEFEARGIPIYPSLEAFYAEQTADLMVMSPPIHLHRPLTEAALAHGANVLCEKPLTATVQDARAMLHAERASGKFVGIGYQWSYSPVIQALKQDVMDGVLGRPLRLKTKTFWPRRADYYKRNNWAAKVKSASGAWILDSPAHNATAHYLHNCFFVLGASLAASAWPVDVQAELYRANAIENYDTAAIRAHTSAGVEILFYTTHAVPNNIGPIFRYEFENAVVEYTAYAGPIVARFADGRVKDYGDPFAGQADKLWAAVDAVRTGASLPCGIETAIPQVVCINGAQESMGDVATFPADVVRYDGEGDGRLTWVDGLQETIEACFDANVLPSELGTVSWAQAGTVVDLREYREFPSIG